MKVRTGDGAGTVNPERYELQKVAAVQTLITLTNRIRNMATTKIKIARKPIMSPALEAEIEASLAQYTQRTKWEQWGMDSLRKQGNMVLLYGEPGTGKTVIAEYMSKRLSKGMVTLNMKDVGGKAPGHTERMVHEVFYTARVGGNKTIFMDECEAVVWDRGRAGSDSMWMVGVIDEILMQTAKYKGLIVAATNREDIIDPALKSRCFAALHVGMPGAPERERIWMQKIPPRFPVQLTKTNAERLSEFEITGRDIETAIVRAASTAIVEKREPKYLDLVNACSKISK